MVKNLTEKQQKFIDVLFNEAQGDPVKDQTKKFIAQSSTKAAYTMYSVMSDPTDLGVKEKMLAAKDLLDRAGFVKTDKVEVKAQEPLFILPAKEND